MNEVTAQERNGVRNPEASSAAVVEKTMATQSVKELREQAERAIARLPENVRREVMDRFAERLDAGLKAERGHERAGGSRDQLGQVLDTRLKQVDQARVARQSPAPTQKASEPGRRVRDKSGPDLSL
jgi:hypothetical protein